jgi:hypothetical protein
MHALWHSCSIELKTKENKDRRETTFGRSTSFRHLQVCLRWYAYLRTDTYGRITVECLGSAACQAWDTSHHGGRMLIVLQVRCHMQDFTGAYSCIIIYSVYILHAYSCTERGMVCRIHTNTTRKSCHLRIYDCSVVM